jgi:hypothetical protein
LLTAVQAQDALLAVTLKVPLPAADATEADTGTSVKAQVGVVAVAVLLSRLESSEDEVTVAVLTSDAPKPALTWRPA